MIVSVSIFGDSVLVSYARVLLKDCCLLCVCLVWGERSETGWCVVSFNRGILYTGFVFSKEGEVFKLGKEYGAVCVSLKFLFIFLPDVVVICSCCSVEGDVMSWPFTAERLIFQSW